MIRLFINTVSLVLTFSVLLNSNSLFAQGTGAINGVDHLASLVRQENFYPAKNILSDKLGFSTTSVLGANGSGILNTFVWFEDQTYFELVTITEVTPVTAPFIDFLKYFEGGIFYMLDVPSISNTVNHLNTIGIPNFGVIPGGPVVLADTQELISPQLWNFTTTAAPAPGSPFYFVEYFSEQVAQSFVDFPEIAPTPNANTAKSIDKVFIVVNNMQEAVAYYRNLGFAVLENKQAPYLGASGAIIPFNKNKIFLLEANGPGIVADFAATRGTGILGMSVEARDLETALDYIELNTGLEINTFEHRNRERFLIPTSLTNDFLIEMVESRS